MSNFSCPVDSTEAEIITLAHGSGGKLTSRLIETLLLPALGNSKLDPLEDGAVLENMDQSIVMSSDSFVVSPLFFPGGDIGELAVCGTVNDLVMMGATPKYLSLSFILEEGLAISELKAIIQSIAAAAEKAEVNIVCGDTKVVERGKGDKVFVNTTGVGFRAKESVIGVAGIQAGDALLISGDIGRHGLSIMMAREEFALDGLEFEEPLQSDVDCLLSRVRALQEQSVDIHCMRDLTRGGLGTAAYELAGSSGLEFVLEENSVPIKNSVKALSQVLGLDPLFIANEGCFLLVVPSSEVDLSLQILNRFSEGQWARQIGFVESIGSGVATVKNRYGVKRRLDLPLGEQLPRIC